MIRFCEQNFVHGTEEVLNKLRNDGLGEHIELITNGECLDAPYAYINERLITGDTPIELYDKIKSEL